MSNFYTDLSTMPDRELIKMYRCQRCTCDNINKNCNMCNRAIAELNNRHKDVINVYAYKLWKEFHMYDGGKDVEDYQGELQFKMLENMYSKIDLERIDNNFQPQKMFYQTFMSLRNQYVNHRTQIYKHNFSECYFDDIMNDSPSMHKNINDIFQKTIERITKISREDFTEELCSTIDFEKKLKELTDNEKFIVEKLMEGWKQNEIAKEMKKSTAYVTVIKKRIARKLYNLG